MNHIISSMLFKRKETKCWIQTSFSILLIKSLSNQLLNTEGMFKIPVVFVYILKTDTPDTSGHLWIVYRPFWLLKFFVQLWSSNLKLLVYPFTNSEFVKKVPKFWVSINNLFLRCSKLVSVNKAKLEELYYDLWCKCLKSVSQCFFTFILLKL